MGSRATPRVLGRLAATFVVGTSAACSLLVSLDDLTGGDAGVTTTDGSFDASTDGTSSSDAPVTVDAAGDGAADARADAFDAGPFCLRAPHDFCADFDQSPAVQAGWDGLYFSPKDGGAAALDFKMSVSSPASASVRTFATPGNRGVILERGLVQSVSTAAHFSVEARVDSDTTVGSMLIFSLIFNSGAPTPVYELALVVRGTRMELQEHHSDGGPFDTVKLADLAGATWTRVDGDIFFTGISVVTPPHAVIRVNGIQAIDKVLQPYNHAGKLVLQAGTIFTDVPVETHVHLDNITVDVD